MPVMTKSASSAVRMPVSIPTEVFWRLSVEQYHAMIRTGILTDDDPVELLEGWLIKKMPKNPAHRVATQLIRKALEAIIPEGWYVDSQEPITLLQSEPEPDVVIIQGETRHYLDRHPGSKDVALIVEVADTTLSRDRETKKRLYAREFIPIYWIVNLPESQMEVYTEPTGPADEPTYQDSRIYQRSDLIPVVIAGHEVGQLSVQTLLP